MELAKTYDCTGCGACEQICPQKAIFFADDHEGFPTPHIRKDKCIECGLCNKVCPALNMPGTNRIRNAYAVQLKDNNTLRESTSGGVFTALAREIFRRGGVVYGCVWSDDYEAILCKAECEADLIAMHGSKYVWSKAGNTFPEIKKLLGENRVVLFTGLPCQVAGLRNYLGKEYQNLYAVSFFCGGAPSPFAFEKYLQTITGKTPPAQLDLKFREKEPKGVGVNVSYQQGHKRIHQSYVSNPYYYAFYKKVINRRSCYHCPYRYENRIDDMTMGDYWGIGKYHPEFDVKAGVSAVLVNSVHGEELFDSVRDQLRISVTQAENIAPYNNLTLGTEKITFPIPSFREDFFRILEKKGWKAAEWKYLNNKQRTRLWIRSIVPVSIKRVLKKLGMQ